MFGHVQSRRRDVWGWRLSVACRRSGGGAERSCVWMWRTLSWRKTFIAAALLSILSGCDQPPTAAASISFCLFILDFISHSNFSRTSRHFAKSADWWWDQENKSDGRNRCFEVQDNLEDVAAARRRSTFAAKMHISSILC